jgi:hypothetical protein
MTHDRVLRLRPLFASPEDAARHAASEGLAWIAESQQATPQRCGVHDAHLGTLSAHTPPHRPVAV